MKLNNKYIVLAFGLGLVTLTSCNMDETPTTSIEIESDSTAINSVLDLTSMTNGAYQSFRSTFYGDVSEVEEVMCDGFNATADYGNNFGPVHRMDVSYTASDYDTESMWGKFYAAIKDYNVLINNSTIFAKNNPAYKAEAAQANGVARFFRAYSYMQLVRHFAKAYNASTAASDLAVPLVLKYDQNAKPARATVKVVYDQIKADLDSASKDLANVPGAVRSKAVTIDAVNMLYARYYLDTKDYDNAALFALKVINSKAGYKLSEDATAMTAEYSKDNGTESIMQLPATLTENGSGTNDIYTKSDFYSPLKQAGYPGAGVYQQPYFLPSKKLISQYENTDLRLGQWFQTGAYTVSLAGSFYEQGITTFVKYLGNPELNSNGTPNARQHVKPFLIGEAYLILAEADFYKGVPGDAKTYLNELQTARKATATEATEATIQNEWFKETVGEGLRMSCLKRWGKGFSGREAQDGLADSGIIQTGASYEKKEMKADDVHWVWPIPSYEIRVNSNLVQNPGF